MSEDKKLPLDERQTLFEKLNETIVNELAELSQPSEEIKSDATLPETFKNPEALKASVQSALGKKVKAVAYGPFGQMLHEGAEDYLKENEPEFWARLQKDKFGS